MKQQDTDIAAFARQLPKADLHVHFEGLVGPSEYAALLTLNNRRRRDTPSLSDIYLEHYVDLGAFIAAIRASNCLLTTRHACSLVVASYMERCARDGIVHVELSFEPEFHLRRGLSVDELCGGISEGLSFGKVQHGISSQLVLSIARDLPVEIAYSNVVAVAATGTPVAAIGFASNEIGHRITKFSDFFSEMRAKGYRVIAHGGEAGDASYVWDLIEMVAVDRIDHGVRATEDDDLLRELVRREIPVSMCPVSNHITGTSLFGEAALLMYRKGVRVSLNTDDPGVQRSCILDDYAMVTRRGDLTCDDLANLARNSLESSFLCGDRKRTLVSQLNSQLASV